MALLLYPKECLARRPSFHRSGSPRLDQAVLYGGPLVSFYEGEPEHDENACGLFPTNKASERKQFLKYHDAAKPQLLSKAPCGQEQSWAVVHHCFRGVQGWQAVVLEDLRASGGPVALGGPNRDQN